MRQKEIQEKKLQTPRVRTGGFTLIEVMIAMAIFTVIMVIGIGAVLDTITQHHTTENIRGVMDNLNFVMEDMVRNIRLGADVHCALSTDGTYVDPTTGAITPQSCYGTTTSGGSNKIVFKDLTRKHNITYTISAAAPGVPSQIFKQIDDVSSGTLVLGTAEPISSDNIEMDFNLSGFTVRGAEPGTIGADHSQPSVVIRLAGTIKYKTYNSKFAVQTTVTLRALDS